MGLAGWGTAGELGTRDTSSAAAMARTLWADWREARARRRRRERTASSSLESAWSSFSTSSRRPNIPFHTRDTSPRCLLFCVDGVSGGAGSAATPRRPRPRRRRRRLLPWQLPRSGAGESDRIGEEENAKLPCGFRTCFFVANFRKQGRKDRFVPRFWGGKASGKASW